MNFLNKLIDISYIKRIKFRKDINGLRAVAVLAVVFYHAEFELFKGGWLGVDIFFVISGYLISNIIISELNEGTFTFKKFYLRRVRRILPALFSTILLTIPFAYFLLTPKAMDEYVSSIISSVFFYSNFHFMNLDFYITESTKVMPLLHTWSLAIEEQFYILFPLLALFIYKNFKKYFTLVMGIIIFSSIYINTLSQSLDKFYRLDYRIWELLLGCLVMIVSCNLKIKHLEKIGFPLLLFSIFYFDDDWVIDIEPKLIALTGVSMVLFSNSEDTFLTEFLKTKSFQWIGISSYSIYLLHQPIFAFYRLFKNNVHIQNNPLPSSLDIIKYKIPELNSVNTLFEIGVLIVLTLIIGYVSFKNIELKAKKLNPILALFFLIFVFCCIQIINPSSYLSNSYSDLDLTQETAFSNYECWNVNNFLDHPSIMGDCFIDNNSKEYLLVLGDSGIISIAKNLFKDNNLNNYNIVIKSSGYKNFFLDFTEYKNCSDCIFSWIENNKDNLNILISLELHRWIEEEGIYHTKTYSGEDANVLNSNLELLSQLSKNIIFIEPFPTLVTEKPGPKDFLLLETSYLIDEIYISLSDWEDNTVKTTRVINQFKNNFPNFYFLDSSALFCQNNSNKCNVYKDRKLFYIDQTHLSIEGGNVILEQVKKILNSN